MSVIPSLGSPDPAALEVESSDEPSRDWLASRVPFFYGWVVLPTATLAHVMTTPGQSYGVSTFIAEFRRDLHLSDAQIGGAYMLGTLLGCLPIWLWGSAMDRFGPRRTSAAVVFALGASCVLTAFVSNLATLVLSFFLLRTLANGALSLLAQNTIAMWFQERLGVATGIHQLGVCASFSLAPYAMTALNDSYGWRESYLVMGVGIWLVMLPVLAIVSRDRPEDVGQFPDGVANRPRGVFAPARLAASPPGGSALTSSDSDDDFTAAEAIRSRPYWIILLAHSTWALVGTGVVFHLFTLLGDQGLERAEIAPSFITFGAAMAVAHLIGGWLVDRGGMNRVLALGLCLMAGANLMLLDAGSPIAAHLFGFLFGGGQGLAASVAQAAWAKYYGRTHLGAIRGGVWTAVIAGSAIGPYLMALSKDLSGDFAPSVIAFAGWFGFLALLAAWGLPERQAFKAALLARRLTAKGSVTV
ncbi:MAG TPA: MFS transporter [Pirellulales bacterium]